MIKSKNNNEEEKQSVISASSFTKFEANFVGCVELLSHSY